MKTRTYFAIIVAATLIFGVLRLHTRANPIRFALVEIESNTKSIYENGIGPGYNAAEPLPKNVERRRRSPQETAECSKNGGSEYRERYRRKRRRG